MEDRLFIVSRAMTTTSVLIQANEKQDTVFHQKNAPGVDAKTGKMWDLTSNTYLPTFEVMNQ